MATAAFNSTAGGSGRRKQLIVRTILLQLLTLALLLEVSSSLSNSLLSVRSVPLVCSYQKSNKCAQRDLFHSSRNFSPTRDAVFTNGNKRSVQGMNKRHVTITSLSGTTNDNTNPDNGRRNPIQIARIIAARIVAKVQLIVARWVAFCATFKSRFARLSKKAKVLVTVQLLALTLLLGGVTRQVVVGGMNARGRGAGITKMKPVETSYSSFLDLCEKSGKGHMPGEHPAVQLEDVRIGRDRIHFRVKQDDEKHAIALESKNLVKSDDISTRAVKEREVFAMKVSASPDLLQTMRENKIMFRAASSKTSRAMIQSSRVVLGMFYFLFLLRMYKTVSGGGGGGVSRLSLL